MYHKLSKCLTLLICICASGIVARGQQTQTSSDFQTKSNRENAPYSRFGIGEYSDGINPVLKAMGGIGAAYNNPFSVNTTNPASYSTLLLTTYQGSLVGSNRTISSGNEKFRTGKATINQLAIGVPVGKGMGLSFGYKPMTSIYYFLSDTAVIGNYGNSVKTSAGDGSLNYAYFGYAGRFKGFSAGFNFGYLFGSTVYASLLESIDNNENVNDAQFSNVVKTGGLYWNAGVQHEAKLRDNLWLHTGATLAVNQKIKTTVDEFWTSYNFSGGDTSYSRLGQEGFTTTPLEYSIGAQLIDSNTWLVGVNFSARDYSNYSGFGRTDSVANMSYRLGVGGGYTPDASSIRNYFNRVTYRVGFYYGTDYVSLRNTQLNYYAVTFGFGLPFKRYSDRINAAFEIGRRGTEANGLVKENFFKCTFGISLNDKWFIKRKYD